MDVAQIKTEISNIRFYHLESLRALANIAAEIRKVKDAETRTELTRQFEAQHGRKVAVWARIPKRFSAWMGEVKTVDGFLALAYACQLPEEQSRDLVAAHSAHLDEPLVHLLVLRDVNEHKPTRARAASLAARIVDAIEKAQLRQQEILTQYEAYDCATDYSQGMEYVLDLILEPEVARELARRAKVEAKQ